MSAEMTTLDWPMDVLFLIHHGMRTQGEEMEGLARELHVGDSLQRFRMSFNSWASFAAYHSEQEERKTRI